MGMFYRVKRKVTEEPYETLLVDQKRLKLVKDENSKERLMNSRVVLLENAPIHSVSQSVENISDEDCVFDIYEEEEDFEESDVYSEDSNAEDNWRNDYPEEYDFDLESEDSEYEKIVERYNQKYEMD